MSSLNTGCKVSMKVFRKCRLSFGFLFVSLTTSMTGDEELDDEWSEATKTMVG